MPEEPFHHALRRMASLLGPEVLQDAGGLRAALEDFMHDATTGEMNLLVDAVRLDATRLLAEQLRNGSDPHRAIEAAGRYLSEQRGVSEISGSLWACAMVGYAQGVLDDRAVAGFARPGTLAAPPPQPPLPSPPQQPPYPSPPDPTQRLPQTPPGPQWHPPPPPYPGPQGPSVPPVSTVPRRSAAPWIAGIAAGVLLLGGGVAVALAIQQEDPPPPQGPDRDPDEVFLDYTERFFTGDCEGAADLQYFGEGDGTESGWVETCEDYHDDYEVDYVDADASDADPSGNDEPAGTDDIVTLDYTVRFTQDGEERTEDGLYDLVLDGDEWKVWRSVG